jgi:DNA-binding protein, YbaB/EbfC family
MSAKGFGGLPSGMNMGNIMKHAKKMQEDMLKVQEELAQKKFEVTSGGGAVKIIINGKKQIQSLEIAKELIDPEDAETLQDTIISAVNEAVRQADEAAAASMGKLAGSLNGMF